MNKLIISLLLLSFHLTLFAQQTKPTSHPKLALKIEPLPLIDVFGNNAAVLSLEFRGTKNRSISLEMGALYHSIGYGLQNNRGWLIGGEWRKYVTQKEGKYWSVRFRHRSQEYEFTDLIDIEGNPPYEKTHRYEKSVSTLTALYGSQKWTVNKRFFTDVFVGFGIKYKNVKTPELTFEEEENRENGDSQVLRLLNKTGSRFLPTPALGFRVGYRLK